MSPNLNKSDAQAAYDAASKTATQIAKGNDNETVADAAARVRSDIANSTAQLREELQGE